MNFNNIFYLTQYMQSIINPTCNQYKKLLSYFTLLSFHTKSCVYFTCQHIPIPTCHILRARKHVARGHFMRLLLLLLSHFSRVWLCATPLMASSQAPPSLGFSRQEHWSGLPFPSPMHESEKWKWSRSVLSDSSRSHRLQPTRLLRPWDFPGKSTGVGCHCLQPIWGYALVILKLKAEPTEPPVSWFQKTGIIIIIITEFLGIYSAP